MAAPVVRNKRSSVPGKIPTTTDLSFGEFGLNTYDGKVFISESNAVAGVGTTVITVNPWNVGLGSTAYDINFSAGNIGIGSTNPTSKLSVAGDVLVSGVVTATSYYGDGSNLTGITGGTGTNYWSLTSVGINTLSNVGIGTTNPTSKLYVLGDLFVSGVITATTFIGNLTGIATTSTNVIGGIGSITQLQVTGISTFTNGPVLIGAATSTGTALQRLQVTGGAYISTSTGIGTTNPQSTLHVLGNVLVAAGASTSQYITLKPYELNSGTLSWEGSAGQLFSITNNLTSGSIFSVNDISGIPSIDVDASGVISLGAYGGNIGIGTTNPTSKLYVLGNALVSGVVTATTFVGNLTGIASTATTSGYATTAGVSTSVIGGIGSITQLQVTGISTFTNGPVFIGAATSTGTASQRLQVTGGAYVSGSLGIGTTNPVATLQVKDALAFETTNTTTTTTTQVAVDTFATASFRSAKYHAQITCPGQISTLGGITTGGRGYTPGTFNVIFTNSSGTGSAAQGTLVISNGTVGQIGLGTTGGSGYIAGDVLTASGGSGLQVSVGSTDATGSILTLGSITSAGIGYTAGVGIGTTTLTFLGGTGTGAVGLATIYDGVITTATLLQQPTTGTGGTTYYAGSNYTTSTVLTIAKTDVTNTITTITGSVGVSTFTSLTTHGIGVSDIVRTSSTSNGLTAGTDYYVVDVPSTTTFTLGSSVGIGTTFTTGTSLSINFYRNSAAAGGSVAYLNAITGVSTNYQVSDLLVLQNGTSADYVEYASIANNDILGTFAADISGANARLLLTPTYPNNTVKVARQAITL